MSDPVLVFYKSLQCGACTSFTKNFWDKVQAAIKEKYPKLQIVTITAQKMDGIFDVNVYPKDLTYYRQWFPNFLLIPGVVWNNAVKNLGPDNTAKIRDGVQILNGHINSRGFPEHYQEANKNLPSDKKFTLYNNNDPKEFLKWLEAALDNPAFKEASIEKQETKPITPLLEPIAKPKYISDKSKVATSSVCSIRFVSKRK